MCPMDFHLKITPEKGYVHVVYEGDILAKWIAERIMREAGKACREHGIDKILIEERNCRKRARRTMDYYKFASSLDDYGIGVQTKIAVVPDDPNMIDEDAKFMETVAYNRGYSLRWFAAVDDAINWLRE